MNVLLVDNFDSFSFNLVDDLRRRGACVSVWRNDLPADDVWALLLGLPAPRMLVVSPGPGRPEDAGCCEELVRRAVACSEPVPMFGVCLGLQVMVTALGGTVVPCGVAHGRAFKIRHDASGPLAALPSPLLVGRYHSLAAGVVPDELEVTARNDEGVVMALAHRSRPLYAVQFHPESVLTPRGGLLFDELLRWGARRQLVEGKGDA